MQTARLVAAVGGGDGGRRGIRDARVPHDARCPARMSFHPNDVTRRARVASALIAIVIVVAQPAFFRTQVLENEEYALQSEKNRLREIPLPAPRGIDLRPQRAK